MQKILIRDKTSFYVRYIDKKLKEKRNWKFENR